MKKITFLVLTLWLSISMQAQEVERLWGTYFGGRNYEVDEAKLDSQGNIYMYGTVYFMGPPSDLSYITQFISPDAHQHEFGGSGCDTFLAKFDSDGQLVWATLLGGSENDFAYHMSIDAQDQIYVVGNSYSSDNLATPGSFMENPDLALSLTGFVVKFDSDGNRLWGSYYPGNIWNIACDASAYFYITGSTMEESGVATTGAYLENFTSFSLPGMPAVPNGFLTKFDKYGNRIWGTYYGGANPYNVVIDSQQRIYIAGQAFEPENEAHFFASENCHQSETSDSFISRFSADGAREWSTYFASVAHGDYRWATYLMGLATSDDALYVSGFTLENYNNSVATPGAFQTQMSSLENVFLNKFTLDGQRIWGTLLGGNGYETINSFTSVNVKNDVVMLTGMTGSSSGLATAGAYKTDYSGDGQDSFFSRFDTNGNRIWASYYGGSGVELTHGCLQLDEEYFYLWGTTYSLDHIASNDGFQPFLHTDNPLEPTMNGYLAKFKTTTLGSKAFDYSDLKLYPNPNNGVFTLSGNLPTDFQNMQMKIYDNLGREIMTTPIEVSNLKIQQTFDFSAQLFTGIYFAKITSESKILKAIKLTVK